MQIRFFIRRPKWIFQIFLISILTTVILVAIIAYLSSFLSLYENTKSSRNNKIYPDFQLIRLENAKSKQVILPLQFQQQRQQQQQQINNRKNKGAEDAAAAGGGLLSQTPKNNQKCNMFNCFDIYRCGKVEQDQLSIYIYPIERIFLNNNDKPLQQSFSKEFLELLDAIRKSPYYVSDPNKACIFVPTIDLLFYDEKSMPLNDVKAALHTLEFWGKDGANHLLFNMFPKESSLLEITQSAIVASSAYSYQVYRLGFHIPIITFNPILRDSAKNETKQLFDYQMNKKIQAISAQGSLNEQINQEDVIRLDFCIHDPSNYHIRCNGKQIYDYPEILRKTDFCLVIDDLTHPILWDIMRIQCIPVIITDLKRLPFDEIIDWKRNAILLYKHQIKDLSSILRSISSIRKKRLKSQIRVTFNNYFRTIYHITNTVLEIIRDKVFSHAAHSIHDWNINSEYPIQRSPIFYPTVAQKGAGFTAVILAYERVQSLFQVIERVALCPSLVKILIVWNNQAKTPPPVITWPKVNKPIKLVQTEANKLSNRFFPYDEITTEAILSLDDDIIMLTTDEIEFGFEAWREFPDRIVGFPSRTHKWDNFTKRWNYDSEWGNDISMVLTGAAFYHKYWHYAFTYQMPKEIVNWVENEMNCEDIAMNFLVSHKTRKAPIKVTPKKKFKCPTCTNLEMLSSDSGHLAKRTECINKFAQIYGYMPLLPVEYRVDPVLYKVDNLPKKFKRFNDIGNL